MQKKLNVGVIFGGRSGEHEVSLVSATSIISALDRNKYNVVPIGIAKNGTWFAGEGVLEMLKSGKTPAAKLESAILPEPSRKGLYFLKDGRLEPLDIVFPVLHGTFGEDGTIQGLFEMAGIPYVGSGVMGSSVGMDKIIQKDIVAKAGFKTAPYVWFLSAEFLADREKIVRTIEQKLSYPCFVKPSNSGSSVGIAKAKNNRELEAAIEDAARYDLRVIVEEGVENAIEIEASVLGNENPVVSAPGQIISSNEFYDYDAKYVDGKSKAVIPAPLAEKVSKEVQKIAMEVFRILDLSGMARIDFFVKGSDVFFNEANTIPGFTSISMYPKLLEASGVPYSKLLDRLIELGLARHKARTHIKTSYCPKEDWYR